MRKRWRWPIIGVIARTYDYDWLFAVVVWLAVGFLIVVMPALLVDSRGPHHEVYLGTYLLVAIIVYGVPLLAGVLAAGFFFARFLLDEYGSMLVPRRVTEPVREDLRSVHTSTLDESAGFDKLPNH